MLTVFCTWLLQDGVKMSCLVSNTDSFLWEQQAKRFGRDKFLPGLLIYYKAASNSQQILLCEYRTSFKQNPVSLIIIYIYRNKILHVKVLIHSIYFPIHVLLKESYHNSRQIKNIL